MNDIELSNMILRAEALMKSNWLHAVQLLQQAARERPDDPRPLISLGEFYHRRQQYEQAVSTLQSALNIEPHNNYVKYMIANSNFALGNYRMAIVYYDMIDQPGQDIMYNKALTLAYMGRNHESIELLRKLLQEGDSNPFFYFLLIEQLIRVQDYRSAAEYIAQAESRSANHRHLQLLKAITFAKQNQWLNAYDAFSKYDQGSQLNNPDYLHSYAQCAIRIGLSDNAISLLERALDENPYGTALYEELLRLLVQKKQWNKANKYLKQARQYLVRFNPIMRLLESRVKNELEAPGQ